ncbi:hypothetical protein Slin15195_G100280 [Septoria linicola]|uniref:Uncharacterized protein n=1 Tax=Septoria linicola TaxID=215465 RepID=A0A9Q9AX83_9PEZI|nr:hypothetical protein Slin15195_G100280 [Septoria linicola]
MRSFLLSAFIATAFASPITDQIEEGGDNASFCNRAEARVAKAPRAAGKYCSAYLNIPEVTVKTTIGCVTKTVTRTTSTKTYLAYPKTKRVAATITLEDAASGTTTKTITTSVSTATVMSPAVSCPIARQGCQKKRNVYDAPLFDSRPTCLSSYTAATALSKACSCLSIAQSTITTTFTKSGASTSTITMKGAGTKTRTLTRTVTTDTVTITPAYRATKTKSISAIETLFLKGPFKLASGPDYRLDPSNGWAYANGYRTKDVAATFGGDSDCHSSYFALNGTRLMIQYFDGSEDYPSYSLIGNVQPSSNNTAAQVHFTSPETMTRDSVPLSCAFGASADEQNVHAACPLTCTYAGGLGGKMTRREDDAWFVGHEDGEYESFTMYAYQYDGTS